MAGKRKGQFRTGSDGVCEANLYEFTAGGQDNAEPVIRVAAAGIEEALAYVQGAYGDFQIARIEFVGMVRLVSGTPVD